MYLEQNCNALANAHSIPLLLWDERYNSIQYVKELHDSARSSYLLWKAGKLRGDVTECDMRTSRLKFKYAFRHMRADALARLLYCKDSVAFWKDVRKLNSSSIPLATKVGDAVGNKNITHFAEHFSTLLNSVHNTDSKEFVSEHIEHGLSVFRKTVSASDVLDRKQLNWA